MKAPTSRVTIVIPCYDQASYLPEAATSACAQTYEHLEALETLPGIAKHGEVPSRANDVSTSVTGKAQPDDATELWWERLDDETAFWYRWLRDQGGEWPDDFTFRMDPNSELQSDVRDYLDFAPGAHLRILDVGSGPLTILGKCWGNRAVAITAVDPLADRYAMLFDQMGLVPPVMPVVGEAERLAEIFNDDSFDLVYARNCLDHGYDPLASIQQMLKVVKPGSVVFIEHAINEGERQQYKGLHQWNFSVDDGRFVIWQPGRSIDAHSILETEAQVEVSRRDEDSDYLQVALRKNGSPDVRVHGGTRHEAGSLL
jgi:SAM-dependent methyltransferase